ncbi:hypothetical protein CK203_047533 [Vitis vinifera]|uniref:Uncharacterized protein n=1 Tax=Vitis vinifera TaxID=29760 RepID=A0A438GWW8_VITVI|nr:hypothetical protein CK203_047533 [Vitis vinifera]
MAPLPGIEPRIKCAIATATARDESNGAVAGDRTPNQMVPLPLPLLGTNQNGAVAGDGCACHVEYEIAEEAMNFMSYVAEVSRGGQRLQLWKGDWIELEMNQMQEVQAISQTPLQAMPCAICLSYEHLVDECPTIPAEREMFGDCNTYQFQLEDHPNFSWKPQPPQYQQPAAKHHSKPQTLNKLW